MPTTYAKDDGPITKVVARVVKQYHRDLEAAGVTVEILIAANDEGPAVTAHGWPAQALAKINNLQNRAAGNADCRIVVADDCWKAKSPEEKEALIDHECHHFELVKDKYGGVRTDDLGRPKLRIRRHDWELGGFDVIARRRGSLAPEVQVAAKIKRRLEQLEIDWTAAELSASGVGSEEPAMAGA
jgi:hypothetical protein